MVLDFIITANNAFTDEQGRLNIIQTFDRIFPMRFPVIHPQMSIVTKWAFESKDDPNAEHTQKMTFKNIETGQEIIPVTEKKLKAQTGKSEYLQFITNIVGLKFDKPGTYTIEVSMDDDKSNKTAAITVMGNGQPE